MEKQKSTIRVLVDRGLAFLYALLALGGVPQLVALVQSQEGRDLRVPGLILTGWVLFFSYLAVKRWKSGTSPVARNEALGADEFYSSVVGVSHSNKDGSSRQELIRRHCRVGGALKLQREPGNTYDSNAIAVLCEGHQIGYLSAQIAREHARRLDAGEVVMSARVKEVTGGVAGRETLGVNVLIRLSEA